MRPPRLFALAALSSVLACEPSRAPHVATRPVAPPPSDAPWAAAALAQTGASWKQLSTVPYKGKQDDVFFVTSERGFYVNGAGYIYETADGGASWTERVHRPGTYFRAIGFVDERRGFAGNIGPDYFPGVTDAAPLYETSDGGATWSAVDRIAGPKVTGICAIDVLRSKFINAGVLDERVTIRAAGRVGGPASMATSRDGGRTWTSENLSAVAAMILDVKFVDERTGFLCAGSDTEVERSHARILKTKDGGATWRTVYESARPFELTWKCSFPTREVGYATVQSYDERPEIEARVVAKTSDGGEHWTEVPLVRDHAVQEYGVGFVDADTGWIGTRDGGWQTTDGGRTFTHVAMGRAVNKIRPLRTSDGGFVAYAIGSDLFKLDARRPAAAAAPLAVAAGR